jgi:hypothetical protein
VDSGKVLAIGGLGLVVAGVVGFTRYQSWAKEEIHRVQMEAATLRAQRDSITAVAAMRDSLRTVLSATADSLDERTDELRQRVATIEAGRVAAERAVWHLRTSDDTERAFQEAYPEFAPAMRMTEYQPSPEIPPLRYFMLPANTARTFMVYRLRSDSLTKTRDALFKLDTLNVSIIDLKDSIIVLGKLNERAFKIGYDSAFASSTRLTQDLVRELRKPRVNFNVPTLTGMAGALAAGLLVGIVVK